MNSILAIAESLNPVADQCFLTAEGLGSNQSSAFARNATGTPRAKPTATAQTTMGFGVSLFFATRYAASDTCSTPTAVIAAAMSVPAKVDHDPDRVTSQPTANPVMSDTTT